MAAAPGVTMGAARRRTTVVCVGHCALDRVFGVDSWPTGSAKIVASRFEEAGGGMAANAAVAAARLGADVRFWGPSGNDATAALIEAQLRTEGVDTTSLRRFDGMTTSTSAVLVDATGERLVVGYRGTALQAPADWLPTAVLREAGALLADVRWVAGAKAALRAAREAGVPAILDGEVAPKETLQALTGEADQVLFSERGLEVLAGTDHERGLRDVLARGASVAAVTLGERGVQWVEAANPDVIQHLPGFSVTTVDTLAAGDVFHGAYAVAIAEGNPVAEAMRFASAAAAIKCTVPGGRNGAPGRGVVEGFLRERG